MHVSHGILNGSLLPTTRVLRSWLSTVGCWKNEQHYASYSLNFAWFSEKQCFVLLILRFYIILYEICDFWPKIDLVHSKVGYLFATSIHPGLWHSISGGNQPSYNLSKACRVAFQKGICLDFRLQTYILLCRFLMCIMYSHLDIGTPPPNRHWGF